MYLVSARTSVGGLAYEGYCVWNSVGTYAKVGSNRSESFEIALCVGTTSPYLASRFGTQDLFPRDPTIFIYQIEPALEDVEPE
jgi:hypothetical protein